MNYDLKSLEVMIQEALAPLIGIPAPSKRQAKKFIADVLKAMSSEHVTVRRTKLPRKLKKANKKKGVVALTFTHRPFPDVIILNGTIE